MQICLEMHLQRNWSACGSRVRGVSSMRLGRRFLEDASRICAYTSASATAWHNELPGLIPPTFFTLQPSQRANSCPAESIWEGGGLIESHFRQAAQRAGQRAAHEAASRIRNCCAVRGV